MNTRPSLSLSTSHARTHAPHAGTHARKHIHPRAHACLRGYKHTRFLSHFLGTSLPSRIKADCSGSLLLLFTFPWFTPLPRALRTRQGQSSFPQLVTAKMPLGSYSCFQSWTVNVPISWNKPILYLQFCPGTWAHPGSVWLCMALSLASNDSSTWFLFSLNLSQDSSKWQLPSSLSGYLQISCWPFSILPWRLI